MSRSVQKEPGQGQGSASVLGEGQSQGRLQRCLLVDVVILKIKQGSSGELAQPGHAVPMEPCLLQVMPQKLHSSGTQSQECHPCSLGCPLCPHPSPAWNPTPGRRDGTGPHKLRPKGEAF